MREKIKILRERKCRITGDKKRHKTLRKKMKVYVEKLKAQELRRKIKSLAEE